MPDEPAPLPGADEVSLCIVGAGLAGLNALFAACQYLTKADRVVLMDRNPGVGGMWAGTYDYVRLHQPHPMFTAGNILWPKDNPPEHLATKAEVLAHLRHCLQTLRQKVTLIEWFGMTYLGHRETRGPHGYRAEITARAADGAQRVITARRCVKAFGLQVPQLAPLALSSRAVVSLSPHEVFTDADPGSGPLYVIGGGKTGMDTAQAVLGRAPGTDVRLVAGRGTVFLNRDRVFPAGWRRWWAGRTTFATTVDLAMRFDGTNAAEVFDHFRATSCVQLDDRFEHHLFGILSPAENAFIASGLREVVRDYLVDVVDGADGPEIVFRSGNRRAIPAGARIVNCTGYLMREPQEYEPFVSPQGCVVSINTGSMIHILPSFCAYFLVHLWYLDKLSTLPIYELDTATLTRKDPHTAIFAGFALALHNTLLVFHAAPFRVLGECNLDYDFWFPLPRRLVGLTKMKLFGPRYLSHCRAALDRVRETQQVRCGPLVRDPVGRANGGLVGPG